MDAAAVLEALGLADRERVREGLAAALLRADRQRAVFDAAFELYFPLGVGELTGARDAPAGDRDELRDRLAEALAANDTAALTRLAGEAVDMLGRYGSPGSDGWSAHQTLDRLRPQTLLARILAGQRAGGDVGSSGAGSAAAAGAGVGGGFRTGFGGGLSFGPAAGAAGAGSGSGPGSGLGSGGFTDRLDADESRRDPAPYRGLPEPGAHRGAAAGRRAPGSGGDR